MMYAVVAPGFQNIYSNWKDVERVAALYPYPKWAKFQNEEDAIAWLKRNKYGWKLSGVNKYGSTFNSLYIDAQYRISDTFVQYVFDCSRIGNIRIDKPDVTCEYDGTRVNVRADNVYLSNESIGGHMSAIYVLLDLLGPYLDVNILLPYYAIFYALTSYTGTGSRPVCVVRECIKSRLGEVSYTLKMERL